MCCETVTLTANQDNQDIQYSHSNTQNGQNSKSVHSTKNQWFTPYRLGTSKKRFTFTPDSHTVSLILGLYNNSAYYSRGNIYVYIKPALRRGTVNKLQLSISLIFLFKKTTGRKMTVFHIKALLSTHCFTLMKLNVCSLDKWALATVDYCLQD